MARSGVGLPAFRFTDTLRRDGLAKAQETGNRFASSTVQISVPVDLPDRPDVVRREVWQRLRSAVRRPLTILRAPAGYGKTTVLRQAAAQWRSEGLAVRNLEILSPGFAARVKEASESSSPAILLIDELHRVDVETWQRPVTAALAELGAHQHLVLAVRTRPPAALLAVRGALAPETLGREALRFSVEECQELLRLHHPAARVETLGPALHRLTAGWAVALATAARPSGAFPHEAWERYVLDDVLGAQSAAAQALLRASALLGEVSADLCDFVLGRQGSTSLVEGLVTDELLFPVSDEPGWFTHHPLLAETIRRAMHRDDPLWSEALHRTAAAWHLARRDRRRAMAQYFAVSDHHAAAELALGATMTPPRADALELLNALGGVDGDNPAIPGSLSAREAEVLTLLASGLANKDIGLSLYVSVATVKAHVYNIFRKLRVGSRTAAVAQARRLGLLG
ncbi:MAG TPA: LuxR C-terminal-related transcriptional regulator [Polyangia bacterium]